MAKIKIILLCAILLCTITTFAQPAQYTPMTAAGYQMKRLKVDSTLHLPSFCGVPTIRGSVAKEGALAIDTCGALLYMWTNQNGWDTVNTSGGGGVSTDTTSLSNRINLKLNISDTASMLNPYLRKIDTTNKFVNSITRTPGKDSIIFFIGGNRFAIKDSVNGNGAGVTSVGLTMPSAFSVANSPVTTSGTIAVTGSGTVSQYVRGDGTLANFPNSTGGGSSVNYYLNGSISQGTFGGDTYYQLSKTPVIGAGTNFTRTNGAGNGYIASFITDAADPSQLNIPGGNWNVEFYFNTSASGGTPSFYSEIYKVSATNVFTLIASDAANPEGITNGTVVDQYFTSIAVPQTALLITDRLAIRIFVTTSGRTITLHTENGNLSEVLTTFTTGLTALNGLTEQVQNFATDTSGTDFGIISASATHTFNLPTASATNRGALSSANWSTFNNKLGASDTVSLSNRINLKLNIADTSALQRKSIPSYTFLANNTPAAANAQALSFKDTSGTYTGTITWSTSAPTGSTNHSYRWVRVGNMVTLNISLVYGVTSTANTSVIVTLPADCPTPVKPVGLTAASNYLYPAICAGAGSLTGSTIQAFRGGIRNNAANNGFEINMSFTASTIIYYQTTVTYYTN